MNRRRALVSLATGAVVSLLSVSSVYSQGAGGRPARPGGGGPPGMPPFAGGRVTQVDKTKIVVEGREGSQTIMVTSKTKFTMSAEAKIADAKKGSKVLVMGQPSGDGKSVEARMIMINPGESPFGRGGRPGGPGGPGAGPGGRQPGGPGGPGGRPGGPGGPGGFGGFAPPTRGEVTIASPLTVKTDDGKTVVVKTTAETRVMVTKSATIADVKKDEFLMATGKPGANGAFEAETIRIGGGMGGGGRFGGGPGGGPGGRPGGPGAERRRPPQDL